MLDRYIQAIETNQPRAAYALLEDDVRERLDEESFLRRWREYQPELRAQAAALRARRRAGVEIMARVIHGPALESELVRGQEGWRVQNSTALRASTSTPVGTLRAFAAALEQRSYSAVLRLLAPAVGETVEKDIAERLRALNEHLEKDPEIKLSEGRAILRYGGRFKIELIKEDGEWRILDVD